MPLLLMKFADRTHQFFASATAPTMRVQSKLVNSWRLVRTFEINKCPPYAFREMTAECAQMHDNRGVAGCINGTRRRCGHDQGSPQTIAHDKKFEPDVSRAIYRMAIAGPISTAFAHKIQTTRSS